MADQETHGSTPMFGIFLLSMYSLFLIPITLWKLSGGSSEDGEVVKTWSTGKGSNGKGKQTSSMVAHLRTVFSNRMLVAWLAWGLVLWYVKHSMGEVKSFDPFQILQVSLDASDQEIKKAYRRLSLQYHPDKNPDPKAHQYFATYVAKAYKALTDEVSRENYKKYGHPDGPQAMSVSVALPEWFFSKDKQTAPLILLVLLFGGIVAPLGIAAWYLMGTQKYVGANQVMEETQALFLDSRYGVKASQALGRIPETMVCAMEFIQMPTPPEQGTAMDELRKTVLRLHPDLKDKSMFWKRKTSVLKVHMLLLAHLSRADISPVLAKDLNFVLTKGLPLLQEMLGIAILPRVQPGYGWMTPAVGCIELMQCIVQAVPLSSKKAAHVGKSNESAAALLQLPHFDNEVLRKLARKKVKLLPELQQMSTTERQLLLAGCSLTTDQVEDVETMLSAIPTLWVRAHCVVEAEEVDDDVVMEGDLVTCRVKAILTRPTHAVALFEQDATKGKALLAYAPRLPFPKEEVWYFMFVDPTANASMCIVKQNLMQADVIGARYAASFAHKRSTATADSQTDTAHRSSGASDEASAKLLGPSGTSPFAAKHFEAGSSAEQLGQTFELKFYAPLTAGKYDLQLLCMPDTWVGCDRAIPIKLKVEQRTRSDREGRGRRAALVQRTEESDAYIQGSSAGSAVDSDAGQNEDEEDQNDAYDSDEYGTEESGPEDEEGTHSEDD